MIILNLIISPNIKKGSNFDFSPKTGEKLPFP